MADILTIRRSNAPVLFLDIDGVLNSTRFFKSPAYRRLGSHLDDLDPEPCALLNGLLQDTKALVVLSSSWRIFFSTTEISQLLAKRGCHVSFIGVTPRSSDGYRGKEIKSWLKENPVVQRFAIVDDSDDMKPYMRRLVRTSCEDGLQEHHLPKLRKLLVG